MKKINFLLCGLIVLAMTACSGDEPNAGGKPDDKGDGKGESFIALNIVNANSSPRSRAGEPTGDNANGDTSGANDGSGYEDGTEKENEVKNARCYFFKADGTPFTVSSTGSLNWSDFLPTESSDVDDDNISVVCKGTVVMAFDKNAAAKFPEKMIVVINIPKDDTSFDAAMSVTELKEKMATYTAADLKKFSPGTNGFLMANSAYRDAEGQEACEISFDSNKIQTSIELAEENPVDVYVERIAVKLELSADATAGVTDMIFPVMAPTGETDPAKQFEFGGNKIYAKLLGFVPTELANRTYIIKKIDTSWTKDGLGFSWNSPSRFRSFWATSLDVETVDIFPAYSNVQDKFINPFTFDDATGNMGVKYCLENTDAANHTKLLVVAQLMDGNTTTSKPVEIAEWNGTRCLLSELPTRIANLLKNEVYTDAECKTAVSGDNIEFKAVEQNVAKGRYAVTLVSVGTLRQLKLDIDRTART